MTAFYIIIELQICRYICFNEYERYQCYKRNLEKNNTNEFNVKCKNN